MNSYKYTGVHDSKCVTVKAFNMLLLSEWTMEVNMSKIKMDYGICWLFAPVFSFYCLCTGGNVFTKISVPKYQGIQTYQLV